MWFFFMDTLYTCLLFNANENAFEPLKRVKPKTPIFTHIGINLRFSLWKCGQIQQLHRQWMALSTV